MNWIGQNLPPPLSGELKVRMMLFDHLEPVEIGEGETSFNEEGNQGQIIEAVLFFRSVLLFVDTSSHFIS